MEDYLKGREMRTVVKDENSKWNNSDIEVVHARNIKEFKARLDCSTYGYGTVQV